MTVLKKQKNTVSGFFTSLALTATIAGSVIMPNFALASQTSLKTVIGTVDSVEVLTSTYIRKKPIEEKICRVEEVPIYGESESGGDELGGLIIGGLLGAAAGNQLSGADGAGTVGAVTGALIGREHAKNSKKQGKIVGYREQETCTIEKRIKEERIEEITGYRLTIDVDGEMVKLKSSKRYDSGDEIRISRKTTYTLN